MEVPLEITFRNLDPSDFIEARVRERVDRLEKFHGRITSCHVSIEAPHRHHHKGVLYHVRLDLRVPGKDIVVSRDPGDDNAHGDVYVAIRDAFETAERQLAEHTRVMRGDVKAHETPLQGHVLRLMADGGFGFIATNDGREVYFHRNSVVDADFADLKEGQAVMLSVAEDESAEGPQATTVRPIGEMRYMP
jgi:ribosomal subunit interface protein